MTKSDAARIAATEAARARYAEIHAQASASFYLEDREGAHFLASRAARTAAFFAIRSTLPSLSKSKVGAATDRISRDLGFHPSA